MSERKLRVRKDRNSPVLDFAAEELCRYLERMDPDLRTVIVSADDMDSEPCITLGMGSPAPEVPDPLLDDSVAVSIRRGSGRIAGSNERSVLLAVYSLLRELGCGWVRPGPDGERIPRKDLSDLSADYRKTAFRRHRGVCVEGAVSFENVADTIDFLPKLGMNTVFFENYEPLTFFRRWYRHKSNPYLEDENVSDGEILRRIEGFEAEIRRRGLLYHRGGHGWNSEPFGLDGSGWKKVDDASVPDATRPLLAEIGGRRALWNDMPISTNLCYSDPAVRKKMTDAVVRYCREHSKADFLHFWLADGVNNHCECPRCAKARPSDWYVLLLNELDEALEREGIGVRVVFLLYVDLLWAPLRRRLRHPDRFVLMFAPITRSFGQTYADYAGTDADVPPFRRNRLSFASSLSVNLKQLREWQKLFGGDSFVFDYHLMYAHFNDPGYEKCAKILFEDMRSLPAVGLGGMVSCQLLRSYFPTGLPVAAMAAALWDPSADFDDVARRYYAEAFGPDGPAVRDYLSEISGCFRLFDGPSHGKGARIRDVLMRPLQEIRDILARFQPLIRSRAAEDLPRRRDWQILEAHAGYVERLAEVLTLLQGHKDDEAAELLEKMLDGLNRREAELQEALDMNKAQMHWRRRLSPAACETTDVR